MNEFITKLNDLVDKKSRLNLAHEYFDFGNLEYEEIMDNLLFQVKKLIDVHNDKIKKSINISFTVGTNTVSEFELSELFYIGYFVIRILYIDNNENISYIHSEIFNNRINESFGVSRFGYKRNIKMEIGKYHAFFVFEVNSDEFMNLLT